MEYNTPTNRHRNTVLSCMVCMKVVLVATSETDAVAVMNREVDAPRVMYELMVCSKCQMALTSDLQRHPTTTVLNIAIVISNPSYKLVTTLLGYQPKVGTQSGVLYTVASLDGARGRLVPGHLITNMTEVTDTAMKVDEVTDFV